MTILRILGHETQRAALSRLIKAGTLPTTILFSGVAGVGKSLVAREVGYSLLCEKQAFGGCGQCQYCSLTAAGNNPDFVFIECAGEDSAVESIRALLYSLNLKSFFGRNRVVVFNDADAMNAQSSNALLKSLEEPRPNTYFFLISAHRGALPPTLVSRSQVWFFDRLPDRHMRTILHAREKEISESALTVDELMVLADGSLADLEAVVAKSSSWRELTAALDEIASGKLNVVTDLAAALAKDKEYISENLKLMRIHARARMMSSLDPWLKSAWAHFVTNILSAERSITQRNLAATTVLVTLLLALYQNTRGASFTTLPNGGTLLDKITV